MDGDKDKPPTSPILGAGAGRTMPEASGSDSKSKTGDDEEVRVRALLKRLTSSEKKVKRRYGQGDVIQSGIDAFVRVLDTEHKGKYCDSCFESGSDLLVCSRCKGMSYCDKRCQTQDWKNGHKLECKSKTATAINIGVGLGVGSDLKRQTLRLHFHIMMRPGREKEAVEMYDGRFKSFYDLNLREELNTMEGLLMEEVARELKREGNLPDAAMSVEEAYDYFVNLGGIWRMYGTDLFNANLKEQIGWGIFIPVWYFKHSCRPNAAVNQRVGGFQIEVRAIAKIRGNPVVDYLMGNNIPFKERQEYLFERYGFICKCERCLEEDVKGDSVDYATLQELLADTKTSKWEEHLAGHDKGMEMLRTIYHEYDQRVTLQLLRVITLLPGMGCPPATLKRIAEEVRDHLVVSYGQEQADNALQRNKALASLCSEF